MGNQKKKKGKAKVVPALKMSTNCVNKKNKQKTTVYQPTHQLIPYVTALFWSKEALLADAGCVTGRGAEGL